MVSQRSGQFLKRKAFHFSGGFESLREIVH
jgi:hypothetical protein